MLDLRLIRAFVAVAEMESVHRAAEKLNISQSPLSRQIIQLEEALGLALFERVRQRVRLTNEGRRFLEKARLLLAHADETEQAAFRLARGEVGHLAIGYVEAAMHSDILPVALARLKTAHPGVDVKLHRLPSNEQQDAILARRLDYGLVYTAPEDDRFAWMQVLDEPLFLAMSAQDPLPERAVISAQDLHGQHWIALSAVRNPAARRRFLEHCDIAGFAPDIRIETDDLLAGGQQNRCDAGTGKLTRCLAKSPRLSRTAMVSSARSALRALAKRRSQAARSQFHPDSFRGRYIASA